jgi:hypothetical protein
VLNAQLYGGVVTKVTSVANGNTPHIVLKGTAVADVDGIAIVSITGNYRDWRGELVDHGAGFVSLDQGTNWSMMRPTCSVVGM